jgi:type IV pilus assembly protein PilE
MRCSSGRRRDDGARGFTLIELLIVLAIIGILASVSMAGYRSARIRANESTAVAALQAIGQAQFAFAQSCGKQRYAPTLMALGTPMPTSGVAFLSPDLTAADPLIKSGYQFTMAGSALTDSTEQTCTGLVPLTAYQVTADPVTPDLSGFRFFGFNTDRVLFDDTVTFTGNMPETGAPGHGAELK